MLRSLGRTRCVTHNFPNKRYFRDYAAPACVLSTLLNVRISPDLDIVQNHATSPAADILLRNRNFLLRFKDIPSGMLPHSSQESSMPNRNIEVKKRLKYLRQFLIDHNALIESNVIFENHRKSDTLDILNSCLSFLQQQHGHFGCQLNNPKTLLYRTRSAQISDLDSLESNWSSVLFDQSNGRILQIPTASKFSEFDFRYDQCFYDYLYSDDRLATFNLSERFKNSSTSSCPFSCIFYVRISIDSQLLIACKLTFSVAGDGDQSPKIIAIINPLKNKLHRNSVFYTKHDLNFNILEADLRLTLNLGYLPQDLVDLSFLSLMEDEDLCDFEKIHLKALKSTSKSAIQSKIYKIKASDNSLVSVISHWSIYTNPWTKLAEFIAGRHEVQLSSAIDGQSSSRNLDFRRINMQEYKSVMSQRRILSEKAFRIQQRLTNIHKELWLSETSIQNGSSSNIHFANSTPTTSGSSRRSTGSSSTFSKKLRSLEGGKNGGPAIPSSSRQQQLHLPLLSCHMSTLFERMVEHEFFMATAPSLHSSDEEYFWKRFSPDIRHSATMSDSATTPPKSNYPVHGEVFSASPPDSFGSGPSYHEIARLENVNRLLISQEVDHSSDDSSNVASKVSKSSDVQDRKQSNAASTRRDRKISTASFNVVDRADKNSPTSRGRRRRRPLRGDRNDDEDDGPQNRSHSSASTSDLTSANLHKFTKEQEKRHKADWKKNGGRRRSMEIPSIFPPLDNKLESAILEHSSKFNNCPMINGNIDQKIDEHLMNDLKPCFPSTMFNPLTMNDQDELPKFSHANITGTFCDYPNNGIDHSDDASSSTSNQNPFAICNDPNFSSYKFGNSPFKSLKRKREEIAISHIETKKPTNPCLTKLIVPSNMYPTNYSSVIQRGADCGEEQHFHVDHDWSSDSSALPSMDQHWQNNSVTNKLLTNRQIQNALQRLKRVSPTRCTLEPTATENAAFGDTNFNVPDNRGNVNMNYEIISSIREATESSLMLNER